MGRPRNPHSKMVREKSSGRAVCCFVDPATGRRRGVRLGPWGSAEAEEKYARLLGDIRAGAVKAQAPAAGIAVAELCVRFAYRDNDAKEWRSGYDRVPVYKGYPRPPRAVAAGAVQDGD